jgi:hypothetical protein
MPNPVAELNADAAAAFQELAQKCELLCSSLAGVVSQILVHHGPATRAQIGPTLPGRSLMSITPADEADAASPRLITARPMADRSFEGQPRSK